MERWEKQELKKRTEKQQLLSHQKKRKVENLEKEGLQEKVKAKLKQSSKYVIFAFAFDLIHYDLWGLFPEESQVYIYDASQSLSFLFLYYAIYKLISDELPIMKSITSMWLWFSVGDTFTMVYDSEYVNNLNLELYLVNLNILFLCYKFRNEISYKIKEQVYLRYEILRFNLNMERYEGVF